MTTPTVLPPLTRADLAELRSEVKDISLDLATMRGWLERNVGMLVIIGLITGVGSCFLSLAVLLIVLVQR